MFSSKSRFGISILLLILVSLTVLPLCLARPTSHKAKPFHFNRLFLFGDSLSDIGNTINAPITNYLSDEGFFAVNPYTKQHFKRPYRDYNASCYQRPITVPMPWVHDNVTEYFKQWNNGAGWTEYFIQIAQQEGATQSSSVMPSMYLSQSDCQADMEQKNKAHHPEVSMNYAWAAALTTGPLRSFLYNYRGEMSLREITDLWRSCQAEKDQTVAVYKENIPPVSTQLDFFQQDVDQKRVSPSGDDLFIIWSGANDLAANFHNITAGKWSDTISAAEEIFGRAAADNIGNARRLLGDLHDHSKTNTVYVVDMLDLLFMEATYKGNGENLAPYMVDLYNLELRAHAAAFNYNPWNIMNHKRIEIISSYHIYRELRDEDKARPEKDRIFNLAFDDENRPRSCPEPVTEEQKKENCRGYFFQYDGIHPTSQTHQMVAAKVFAKLKTINES
eukprot:Nk52_evm4s2309 gene=Nk52_evmTU4s2309